MGRELFRRPNQTGTDELRCGERVNSKIFVERVASLWHEPPEDMDPQHLREKRATMEGFLQSKLNRSKSALYSPHNQVGD